MIALRLHSFSAYGFKSFAEKVDVVFDSLQDLDFVTEPFELLIPNTVVHGQCDLPEDYILFNLKDLTSQLSNHVVFSTIHTAIENMSVAIANSK